MARRAVSQVIDWKASASQVQAQVIEFQAQVLPSSDKSKFNFLSFQSTLSRVCSPSSDKSKFNFLSFQSTFSRVCRGRLGIEPQHCDRHQERDHLPPCQPSTLLFLVRKIKKDCESFLTTPCCLSTERGNHTTEA